jgi:hypothetical protein
MNTDLCCILDPYYRCEACNAPECERCIDQPLATFEKSHPWFSSGELTGSYFMCSEKNVRVLINREP